MCAVKKVSLKIFVLECWESLFYKVAGLKTCNFIKKRIQHRCFPVKFAKYFKNTCFEERPRMTATGPPVLQLIKKNENKLITLIKTNRNFNSSYLHLFFFYFREFRFYDSTDVVKILIYTYSCLWETAFFCAKRECKNGE